MDTLTEDSAAARSRTLLTMSSFPDGCNALRQTCGLRWLIELLYGDVSSETRQRAERALYNVVQSNPDDQQRCLETRVFALLEDCRDFCELMQAAYTDCGEEDPSIHPICSMKRLLSMSYDHCQVIIQLGGLHALAKVLQIEHEFQPVPNPFCLSLREATVRTLFVMTGIQKSKGSLLCSLPGFMPALVAQLETPCRTLQSATAELLDVLWSEGNSQQMLGVGTKLLNCALRTTGAVDISVLYALRTISTDCKPTRAEICSTDGALAFLVTLLIPECDTPEIAGGIVKNISSDIAASEEYRCIFREHHGLHVLVDHLNKLESLCTLTRVKNACATLRNLSAGCTTDQRMLWELGAVDLLKRHIKSESKETARDARATLKNLYSSGMISIRSERSFNFSFQVDELPSVRHVEKRSNTKRKLSRPASDNVGSSHGNKLGTSRKRPLVCHSLESNCDNVEPSRLSPRKQERLYQSKDALDKHDWLQPERPMSMPRINSVYDTLRAVKQCLSLYEFSLMSDSEDFRRRRHLSQDTDTSSSQETKSEHEQKFIKHDVSPVEEQNSCEKSVPLKVCPDNVSPEQVEYESPVIQNFTCAPPVEEQNSCEKPVPLKVCPVDAIVCPKQVESPAVQNSTCTPPVEEQNTYEKPVPLKLCPVDETVCPKQVESPAVQNSTSAPQCNNSEENKRQRVTPSMHRDHAGIEQSANLPCIEEMTQDSGKSEAASSPEQPVYGEPCQTSPLNLCTRSNSQSGEAEQPILDNQIVEFRERLSQSIQEIGLGQHLTVDTFRTVREIATLPLKISLSRDAYVSGVQLLACRADKSFGEHYHEQVQVILMDHARTVLASVIFCGEVQNCAQFSVRFQYPCRVSADLVYSLQVKYPKSEGEKHLCLKHTPHTLVSQSTGLRLSIREQVRSPITEVTVAKKILAIVESRRG